MSNNHRRLARESRTIEAMINIYCRDQHDTQSELCADCNELLDYARQRLDKCPFQENKTTCAKCPVHCYKPAARQEIRALMRYAGPRIWYRHPRISMARGRGKRMASAPPMTLLLMVSGNSGGDRS